MAEHVQLRCLREPELEIYQFYNVERTFPSHFHEGLLLGCLLRGHRVMLLQDRELIVSPGEVIYVPPRMPHGCRALSEEAVDWLSIQAQLPRMCMLPRRPVVITDADLALRMAMVIGESDVSLLLCGVIQLLKDVFDGRAMGNASVMPCKQTGAYVAGENATTDVRPGEQMDRFRYIRWFRKTRGITPGRHGESVRVNRAKWLIKAGCSLVDAAADFCDQSHLNRVFKKQMGVTPGAWRDAYMGATLR